jgi:hypothetical protein
MFDKRSKKMLLADEICRRGGGYLMLLDSDDLVSNRVAEFVKRRHNGRGYVVDQGYIYDARLRRLSLTSEFDRACGSSVILYLSSDDCRDDDFGWREYVGDTWHAAFRARSEELGRPLEPLPFPAAIYVTNNGENHSVGHRGALAALRATARVVRARAGDSVGQGGHKVPRVVADEFGLPFMSRGTVRYAEAVANAGPATPARF